MPDNDGTQSEPQKIMAPSAENRVDPSRTDAPANNQPAGTTLGPVSTTPESDRQPGTPGAFSAANVTAPGPNDRAGMSAKDLAVPSDAGTLTKDGSTPSVPGKTPNESAQPQAHDVPLQEAVAPIAASGPMHFTHSRQRITKEKLEKMHPSAILAVATDRGYDLGTTSRGGVRAAFLKAQGEDEAEDLVEIPDSFKTESTTAAAGPTDTARVSTPRGTQPGTSSNAGA